MRSFRRCCWRQVPTAWRDTWKKDWGVRSATDSCRGRRRTCRKVGWGTEHREVTTLWMMLTARSNCKRTTSNVCKLQLKVIYSAKLTGVRRTPVAILRHNQTCEAPPRLFRAGLAPRREGEETRNLQTEEEEQRLMEKKRNEGRVQKVGHRWV